MKYTWQVVSYTHFMLCLFHDHSCQKLVWYPWNTKKIFPTPHYQMLPSSLSNTKTILESKLSKALLKSTKGWQKIWCLFKSTPFCIFADEEWCTNEPLTANVMTKGFVYNARTETASILGVLRSLSHYSTKITKNCVQKHPAPLSNAIHPCIKRSQANCMTQNCENLKDFLINL